MGFTVDFVDENVIVVNGSRFAAREAFYDDESGGYYAQLPMENRASLILWIPTVDADPDLGPASVRLILSAYETPAKNLNLEATIEDGAIRLTRWARGHAAGEYDVNVDYLTPVMHQLEDDQWGCEIENVSEVADYLARWGRLPVKAW